MNRETLRNLGIAAAKKAQYGLETLLWIDETARLNFIVCAI
jgi:hypothetical protein